MAHEIFRFFIDDGRYDWNETSSTKGQVRFETEGWPNDPAKPCPYSDAFPTLEEALVGAHEWMVDELITKVLAKLPDGTEKNLTVRV